MSHSTGALVTLSGRGVDILCETSNAVSTLQVARSASATTLDRDPSRLERGAAMAPARPETSNLQLGHYYSGDDAIASLAAQLQSTAGLEGVKRLCLAGNDIQEQGCIAIVDALETHPNITSLDLDSNRIGVRGLQGLARAFRSDWCFLREIVLSHNRIGDRALAAIAPALHSNEHLARLDLSNNQLGDSRAGPGLILRDLLWANRSIVDLNLSWNQLRGKAVMAISTALGATTKGTETQVNPTLKKLGLRFTSIGDVGMVRLVQALAHGQTITHVDLGLNGVRGSAAAAAVADLLRASPVLESLLFDGNEIPEDDVQLMQDACASRSAGGMGMVRLKLGSPNSHVQTTPRDIW